jgi:hypothetical protein
MGFANSVTNTFTSVVNSVTSTAKAMSSTVMQNYSGAAPATIGAGVFCGVVCTEIAIRAIHDGVCLLTTTPAPDALDTLKNNFSANLGSAVFYGLCAVNILPGSAAFGAAIFALYSMGDLKSDDYLMTKLLNHTYTLIINITSPIVTPIVNALSYVVNRISDLVTAIFARLGLPEAPIWVATGLLIGAIIAVKFAYPAFRAAIVAA